MCGDRQPHTQIRGHPGAAEGRQGGQKGRCEGRQILQNPRPHRSATVHHAEAGEPRRDGLQIQRICFGALRVKYYKQLFGEENWNTLSVSYKFHAPRLNNFMKFLWYSRSFK